MFEDILCKKLAKIEMRTLENSRIIHLRKLTFAAPNILYRDRGTCYSNDA